MQYNEETAAEQRQGNFAKLFDINDRQILVYLYRDEDDLLSVVVQLWVAHTDEQLRAQIDVKDDSIAQNLFDTISDCNIDLLIKDIGFNDVFSEFSDRVSE